MTWWVELLVVGDETINCPRPIKAPIAGDSNFGSSGLRFGARGYGSSM
jgi:hypothetical protein